MLRDEALARLTRMLGGTTPPVLQPSEIASLLDDAARPDASGRFVASDADRVWTANAAYAVGDLVVPTTPTGRLYRVTASDGAAGPTEPAWPTSGSVVLDGVTYELDTTSVPTAWQPTYDLAAAAAAGWNEKAGLVSDRFRFADGGDSYDRNQIFEHCVKMAELYESKVRAGGILVGDEGSAQSGLGTFTLGETETRVGIGDDRLIRLARWDGSGKLPRVN